MFIVLVAALESQSVEPFEAAIVDGANPWQIFRYITWPAILPVSMTLILIRMIEAFKIVDLPNVMTNGGPGTATESLTLQAFINWRAIELGSSAAIAYMLLFTVTFFGMIFVNLIRHQAVEGTCNASLLRRRGTMNYCAFAGRRSINSPSPVGMVLSYLALGTWTFVVLLPLYWLVVTSLKLPDPGRSRPFLHSIC